MSISDECKKHLVFVKLAKDSPTTSMFTTCCGTLMCGTSELYMGGSIVVPNGPTVVSNDRPLDLAAWTKFIPEGTKANIPEGVLEFRGDCEFPEMGTVISIMQSHAEYRPECSESLKELAEAGKVILADQLFEN
jgi:hypothetical protein